MNTVNARTIGIHQVSEALVFMAYLMLGVMSFLTWIEMQDQNVRAAALASTSCPWDAALPTTTPTIDGASLLANPSAESVNPVTHIPIGWQVSNWGRNQSHFSVLPEAFSGNYSFRTEITQFTDGDAKWVPQESVPVQPQTGYVFQVHYRSNIPATATAQIWLRDGQQEYIQMGVVQPSSSWQPTTHVLVTPAEAEAVSVFLTINQVGYLESDDYFLGIQRVQPLKEGMVSLTFDDGGKAIYEHGLPLLQKYELVSTQYVITEPLSERKPNYYITKDQLMEFAEAGHEIASHTVNHQNLVEVPQHLVEWEITTAKIDLYRYLGVAVPNFSVPYGKYSESVIHQIKQHYCSHRSTETGFNSPDYFDVYNIKVQNITVDTPVDKIKMWIDYAEDNRVWLVLLFHEIKDDGGEFSYAPAHFEKILAYLKESKLTIPTMSDGILAMEQAILEPIQ